MATLVKNFECRLACKDPIDIGDVEAARAALIGIINDPGFDVMFQDMVDASAVARGAPQPRGGEIGASCHADFSGKGGCEISGRWTF